MNSMKTLLSGAMALALVAGPALAEAAGGHSTGTDQTKSMDSSVTAVTKASETALEMANATAKAVDQTNANLQESDTHTFPADLTDTPLRARDLLGAPVRDSNGDVIGAVDKVVSVNGKMMITVGIGGFLGLGEREVVLPLDKLSTDGKDLFAKTYDKAQLSELPEFQEAEGTTVNSDATVSIDHLS